MIDPSMMASGFPAMGPEANPIVMARFLAENPQAPEILAQLGIRPPPVAPDPSQSPFNMAQLGGLSDGPMPIPPGPPAASAMPPPNMGFAAREGSMVQPMPTPQPAAAVAASKPKMPMDIRPPAQQAGGAAPPAAAGPPGGASGLASLLAGVQAPPAPTVQRIDSPRAPQAGNMPNAAPLIQLMAALMGGAGGAPSIPGLLQTVPGGR